MVKKRRCGGGLGVKVGKGLGDEVRWTEGTGLVYRMYFLFHAGTVGIDSPEL